jgi:Ribbon-helix-helix domain
MEQETVRWNLRVSKRTALALRDFLGSRIKKGELSKFIEEAVRAHIFRCTVQDIKAHNADTDPKELQALIDNTVREVRAERRAKIKHNIV